MPFTDLHITVAWADADHTEFRAVDAIVQISNTRRWAARASPKIDAGGDLNPRCSRPLRTIATATAPRVAIWLFQASMGSEIRCGTAEPA